MAEINKLYPIWIKNENTIASTYGNTSFYTQAKADINKLTTTQLGVGCDSSSNYTLDVSGIARVTGNLDVGGNINVGTGKSITSSWLDASLNARALDTAVVKLTGDQTIAGNKTLSGNLFSSQAIKITNDTTRELRVENLAGTLNSSITYSAIRTTGYFWSQTAGTNAYRGYKTDFSEFYITNNQLWTLNDISTTSTIQAQLNSKVSGTDVMTLSTNQTVTGAKTFTGDVSFNTGTAKFANGITITSGALQLDSGSLVGTNAIRFSGGSIQTNGGIYFAATNLNRKIVLYPVTANEFQNYSIGANNTALTTQFMVPDNTRSYTFSYGTSTTTKADFFKIGLTTNCYTDLAIGDGTNEYMRLLNQSPITGNGGLYLYKSAQFTMTDPTSSLRFQVDPFAGVCDVSGLDTKFTASPITITAATGVRYGGWSTAALDLSGTRLQVENMNVGRSQTGAITGTTTITKPFNQFQPVESTATAYTITLPTITQADLGNSMTFRKVKSGGATTISFIGNGTQKIYNTALTGAATAQGLMTSAVYIVTLVALPDTTTGGALGWFQI